MERMLFCLLTLSAAGLSQTRPPECCGPAAGGAPVEIKGHVDHVRISPGMGMPFVAVKTSKETVVVYLGSMRYLMAHDFNPKTGDSIAVKAFKVANGYVAAVVTLPDRGKTLRLRDENGRPVWRGGPPR
jgi:hypothetical protein